ncbi:hypothetical protein IWX46DRAFT_584898 [Phyllosticta citricarpa]|uniref:Uncharacterized protein n=1 Tax=Phyllosticta citricarpa TaxID=55181 RepID=A0ABR1LBM7_9PEZI
MSAHRVAPPPAVLPRPRENFTKFDRELAMALQEGRPMSSQRALLREAACELDRIGAQGLPFRDSCPASLVSWPMSGASRKQNEASGHGKIVATWCSIFLTLEAVATYCLLTSAPYTFWRLCSAQCAKQTLNLPRLLPPTKRETCSDARVDSCLEFAGEAPLPLWPRPKFETAAMPLMSSSCAENHDAKISSSKSCSARQAVRIPRAPGFNTTTTSSPWLEGSILRRRWVDETVVSRVFAAAPKEHSFAAAVASWERSFTRQPDLGRITAFDTLCVGSVGVDWQIEKLAQMIKVSAVSM